MMRAWGRGRRLAALWLYATAESSAPKSLINGSSFLALLASPLQYTKVSPPSPGHANSSRHGFVRAIAI
jgi:hypothetical protein